MFGYFFETLSWKISSFIKIWQEWRILYMETNIHFCIKSGWIPLRVRNVSGKIYGENRDTHFMFYIYIYIYIYIFRKPCCLWDNVEKILYSRTGNRWQQAHVHCLLCTYFRLSQYATLIAFPLQQWFARTRLIVTLYTYIACLVFQRTVQFVLLHPEVRKNFYINCSDT